MVYPYRYRVQNVQKAVFHHLVSLAIEFRAQAAVQFHAQTSVAYQHEHAAAAYGTSFQFSEVRRRYEQNLVFHITVGRKQRR